MDTILNEVKAERVAQDAQWGGPDHDDEHTAQEFICFIEAQLRKCDRGTGPDTRERLIKVAALAVAAVQMMDRTTRDTERHTPEKKISLNSLAVEIIEINIANGWNVLKPEQWEDTYKVPAILALIHSETSEALEAFRKGDKANFSEELADTLIRVLDCAGGLGIDIDSAVAAKLAKNKTRGFRHGGKRV